MLIKRMLNKILRRELSLKEQLIAGGAKIGNDVFWGEGVEIDLVCPFLVELQDGVVIASGTKLVLHDSCLPNVKGSGDLRVGKIILKKQAYVGANSVILPGVIIGEGAIVSAMSLVNKNIPAHEVWGGNPVNYLCTVDELITRRKQNKKEGILDIPFVGQIEKKNIDYQEYKNKVLSKVKRHFKI